MRVIEDMGVACNSQSARPGDLIQKPNAGAFSSIAQSRVGKRPILIVDDEPDMLHSLRNLLRDEYQVFTAASGAEGSAILQKNKIHVVLTDQRMPNMTGVDFLKKIKNEHPETIRLLFTGYSHVDAIIDAINKAGIFRYICKPCDPEQLFATLWEAGATYDLAYERQQLLQDLKKNKQEWMAFEAEFGADPAYTLPIAAREKKDELQRKARQLHERLETILAASQPGLLA